MLHMHSNCCSAMERKMTQLTLRSVRPEEPQEVADTDARLLSQVLIGTVAVLSVIPFIAYFLQH